MSYVKYILNIYHLNGFYDIKILILTETYNFEFEI